MKPNAKQNKPQQCAEGSSAAGPVHQPMEGGLPSDDEEVLLPYGKELKSSESTVLPVHHSLPPLHPPPDTDLLQAFLHALLLPRTKLQISAQLSFNF